MGRLAFICLSRIAPIAVGVGLAAMACSTFSEGTPDADAGADAGPMVAFCKSAPSTFCDDFDDPGIGWSYSVVHDGGTLAVEDATAVSRPSALHARLIPPAPLEECRYAYRFKDVRESATGGFRLAYQVLPGAL